MNGMPLIPRFVEFGASLAVLVLFVLTWRQTRIGGFGALAALRGVTMVQWIAYWIMSNGGGWAAGLAFSPWLSMLLTIGYAFAAWNIYTHIKRIWAPVEAPPATVT